MTTYDGVAEATAIFERLKTLVGGRVLDGVDDAYEPPVGTDATVKPYIVFLTSDPIPTANDRGLGPDTTQPYILPFSTVAIAGDADVARRTQAGITNLLLDWSPSSTAGTCKPTTGRQFTTIATENKPSRDHRMRGWEVRINL